MLHPKHEKRFTLVGLFTISASNPALRVFIGTQNVLRTEVAATDAVGTSKNQRHFIGCDRWQDPSMLVCFHRFAESGTNVASQRIVCGQTFVSALENNHLLLAFERLDHGCLGKGSNDIDVDGAHLGVFGRTQVIDGFFDIFGCTTERDKHCVCILGFVGADQSVMTPGQLAELGVSILKEAKDRLVKIVSAGHNPVHVMFLILHWAEEDGGLQVHHFGNTAPLGPKQFGLGRRRRVNHVIRRSEKLTKQICLWRVIGALGVGGQHAILNIHSRIQA